MTTSRALILVPRRAAAFSTRSVGASRAPQLFTASRRQSTLSAQPVEMTAPATFDLRFTGNRTGLSTWADEADKWLATRRALEHVSDERVTQQLTASTPCGSLNVWTDEFVGWARAAPKVAARVSTSYACAVATHPGSRKPANSTWAMETEHWLAHKRYAEHASDKLLAEEVIWFK
eukprot:CAMPEP_0206057338 /NCGR_PEP_ID=MMETSP1466-20131121/44162_1 /ASSEMBLY_ACC=CAM_ASM_001126 /TAXON_ID=44452 /ORGANISM="Pavlova gyrans, Strain CCMP608" /LENGTH=175 /DNA_ID=CAMNT_0053432611 /DNA_START=48 /DNA_END=575 /DNA_ORIENTATION=-